MRRAPSSMPSISSAAASAQTAFCAVRPPGHHAERGRAMGFCVFNNVAVGAAHALAAHGLSRVAIVDFDVHHGNGTEEIFSDDPRVLMVSTFQYPLYPYSGVDNPAPNMVNVPLSAGSGSAEFRDAVVKHWLPALERAPAGADPHLRRLRRASRGSAGRPAVHRERLRVGDARADRRRRSATRRAASCRRSKAAMRCPRSAAALPRTCAS